MRTLKFKAWDPSTKRMFGPFALFGEATAFDLVYQWVMEAPGSKTGLERMADIQVMQFTGLHDRNGREIFEGDVCNILRNKKWETCHVIWSGGKECGFSLRGYWGADYYGVRFSEPREIEVIGNIHENPDLVGRVG